jgi:hypothetical protein
MAAYFNTKDIDIGLWVYLLDRFDVGTYATRGCMDIEITDCY